MQLRPELTAAIAAISAATIAGYIAFLNLTLAKEQKTSEFRQAWIDALRNDLTTFLASARAMARAMAFRHTHEAIPTDLADAPFTPEKISELRYQAAESINRIKLRINPFEADHKELERLLEEAVKSQNSNIKKREKDDSEVLKAIDRVLDQARLVLKKEWQRVKEGEQQFKMAKWGVPIGILILAIFLYYFVSH